MPTGSEFSRNPAPSVTTTTAPPDLQSEVTFISGVAPNATVAATSFGAWTAFEPNPSIPAQYNPYYSNATKWGDPTLQLAGTPAVVTYQFDTASNWTPAEKDAWVAALALWSAEVAISFMPVVEGGTPDLTFFVQPRPGAPFSTSGSYQSFPDGAPSVIGSNVESVPGADAFITLDIKSSANPNGDTDPLGDTFAASNDFYFALIHELGHAIGLGHGGPYNQGDVTPFDAAVRQFSPYDMSLWAMMSYITPSMTNATFYADYPVTGTSWGSAIDGFSQPITPMMLDILAAQRVYGPATSGPLFGDNHVFGFNSNIAGPIAPYFDFNINTSPVVTIWDRGLHSTLDLSGWSAPEIINLNPGTFSSANGYTNNIGIAFNTVIEKAVGGGGNDTIFGNAYDNILVGGPGNDLVIGGPGADRFALGTPADGGDTYFDFSHYQGDLITLDHVGFGVSGIGSLAAVGVNFVYAFTPPSPGYNGPTPAAGPTLIDYGSDVYWDPDGAGATPATLLAHVFGQGTAAPPVTRNALPDVMAVDPSTDAVDAFKVAQLTQYDFMFV